MASSAMLFRNMLRDKQWHWITFGGSIMFLEIFLYIAFRRSEKPTKKDVGAFAKWMCLSFGFLALLPAWLAFVNNDWYHREFTISASLIMSAVLITAVIFRIDRIRL